MATVIVLTSGKGGVGKTVASASIALGIALRGKKTVVADLDIGLRNLDMALGCERRVVFDIINVLQGEAELNDALIRNRHSDNLYVLPASQTRDKDALSKNGLAKLIDRLSEEDFEYIIFDSPSGLDRGAKLSLYFADEVIFVANPTRASLRACDRMLGILQQESRKLQSSDGAVVERLLINRYLSDSATGVPANGSVARQHMVESLGIELLGVVPESALVSAAAESGIPVIADKSTVAGAAFDVVVSRLLGENLIVDDESEASTAGARGGLFDKLLGR